MENIQDEKEELKTEDNPQVSEPEEPTEPVEETQPEEISEEQPEEAEEEEVKPEETAVSPEKELAPAEEERKPEREVGKEEEEEVVEERFYTVPLEKAWIMPANKRAPRAMRMLKAFITKHMKMGTRPEASEGEEEKEPARLIINNDVNLRIWSRGIEKPPRKIRVRVTKDKEDNITVHLAEGE